MSDKLTFVPNKPFREYVEAKVAAGELSWNQLANALGYGKNDSSYVQRQLGKRPDHGRYHTQIRYETAVKYVKLLGLHPVDFGV